MRSNVVSRVASEGGRSIPEKIRKVVLRYIRTVGELRKKWNYEKVTNRRASFETRIEKWIAATSYTAASYRLHVNIVHGRTNDPKTLEGAWFEYVPGYYSMTPNDTITVYSYAKHISPKLAVVVALAAQTIIDAGLKIKAGGFLRKNLNSTNTWKIIKYELEKRSRAANKIKQTFRSAIGGGSHPRSPGSSLLHRLYALKAGGFNKNASAERMAFRSAMQSRKDARKDARKRKRTSTPSRSTR